MYLRGGIEGNVHVGTLTSQRSKSQSGRRLHSKCSCAVVYWRRLHPVSPLRSTISSSDKGLIISDLECSIYPIAQIHKDICIIALTWLFFYTCSHPHSPHLPCTHPSSQQEWMSGCILARIPSGTLPIRPVRDETRDGCEEGPDCRCISAKNDVLKEGYIQKLDHSKIQKEGRNTPRYSHQQI